MRLIWQDSPRRFDFPPAKIDISDIPPSVFFNKLKVELPTVLSGHHIVRKSHRNVDVLSVLLGKFSGVLSEEAKSGEVLSAESGSEYLKTSIT